MKINFLFCFDEKTGFFIGVEADGGQLLFTRGGEVFEVVDDAKRAFDEMRGRKLVSGDFHSNSSTYCMAFSSSTKIKRCSFLSNFAAAVSARQASLAFGSRTWKKTALVRGASPFVMCAWEDNAAGDEVFKGVFFGHVAGLDVLFANEKGKAGDGVRGGGGKYRDEGLSCFFWAF